LVSHAICFPFLVKISSRHTFAQVEGVRNMDMAEMQRDLLGGCSCLQEFGSQLNGQLKRRVRQFVAL